MRPNAIAGTFHQSAAPRAAVPTGFRDQRAVQTRVAAMQLLLETASRRVWGQHQQRDRQV